MARPVYNGGLPAMITVAQGQYDVNDTIYTIPPDTFTDPDGDDLYYGMSFAPDWLGFTDNGTDQFFYLKQAIQSSEVGIISNVRVTAMDSGWANTSAYINFKAVAASSDAPNPGPSGGVMMGGYSL